MTTPDTPMADLIPPPVKAGGAMPSRPYQIYVLVLLTLIVVLNYMDRGALAVLQEPVKQSLKLTDAQLGLLTGPAFAIFYAVSGLSSARLAERFNRSTLISICMALWSVATAACGLATGFGQLAFSRLGVGLGEGGTAPINYSLAAETFSAKQRGLVMSIVTAGSPISGIITPVLVAYLAQLYGWRAAFFFVGLPGLALAVLIRLTLKEPREQPGADLSDRRPGTFWSDARFLFTNPAYVLTFVAAAFTGAAVSAQAFRVSFLIRVHHIKLAEAGGILSIASIFGLMGAFFGGWLADRLADERGRSYCYVPGITGLLTFGFTTAAFMTPDLTMVTVLLSIGAFVYAMKEGPITAAVQNIVLPRMRATAAAVHMIAPTVIGGSIGPVLAGAISDSVASKAFAGQAMSFAQACPGGRAMHATSKALTHACVSASGHGVQTALVVVGVTYAIGAVFFLLAAIYVKRGDTGADRLSTA